MRRRPGPAARLEGRDGVAHHHGRAGELQHLAVVQVVAGRHHLAAVDAQALRPDRQRRALGAAAGGEVEQGEVAGRIFGQRDGQRAGRRQAAHVGGQGAHVGDAARVRDLHRVLRQRALDRLGARHELPVPFVVPRALRMAPVDAVVQVLPRVGPIEDDGDARTPRAQRGQHGARGGARQQAARQRVAAGRLGQRAVAHDQDGVAGQLGGDRQGVMIGAAGRQHHLQAGVDRPPHGAAVAPRQVAAAVEQGAVDVDGDQADGHELRGSGAGRGGAALRAYVRSTYSSTSARKASASSSYEPRSVRA